MPKFEVISRVDAFVDYIAEVEAESPEAAVEKAYNGAKGIVWEHYGIVEFDARRIVALDDDGIPMESTARGRLL
jgi:hypothetical protein